MTNPLEQIRDVIADTLNAVEKMREVRRILDASQGYVCVPVETIQQNAEDAKRLRALEQAIKEWGGDTIPNIVVFLMSRADEILREGEPHDQD